MPPVATTDDGVPVAWYELGEDARGGRPALLLAHATGFHGRAFAPLAMALSGFRCIAFDERGHGATPPRNDASFDWNGFARDVLAVVDAAGVAGRALGFGHSAGGAALLLAELARPGTFRAIYCYEPIVHPADELPAVTSDNPMSAAARRRRDVFPSKDAAYDNYASKPPMASFHPDALRAYVDHGFEDVPVGEGEGVRLRCRPEWEARTYEMGTRHGAFGRLGEVACPVTIAWGSETTTFWPGAFEQQLTRVRHGRGERFDGLGHFGPFEAPDRVAESVQRAFATLAGA
ncbi:MAG TPA: alpha/beta hydrolase [Acidimicrobiales bacterium]